VSQGIKLIFTTVEIDFYHRGNRFLPPGEIDFYHRGIYFFPLWTIVDRKKKVRQYKCPTSRQLQKNIIIMKSRKNNKECAHVKKIIN